MTSRHRPDRGSASVELVLMTPLLVMLLLFVVAVGRLTAARGEVDAAARDGARAAANARTPGDAEHAALVAATATLRDRGIECAALDVGVDTTQYRADGYVEVTVSCAVDLHAAAGIGFPYTQTLYGTFVAPVDRYRGIGDA